MHTINDDNTDSSNTITTIIIGTCMAAIAVSICFFLYLSGFVFIGGLLLPFIFLATTLTEISAPMWLLLSHTAITIGLSLHRSEIHILQIIAVLIHAIFIFTQLPFYPMLFVLYCTAALGLSFQFPTINLFNTLAFITLSLALGLSFASLFPFFQAVTVCATLFFLGNQEDCADNSALIAILFIQLMTSIMSIFIGPFPFFLAQAITMMLLTQVEFKSQTAQYYKAALMLSLAPLSFMFSPWATYSIITTLTTLVSPILIISSSIITNLVLSYQSNWTVKIGNPEALQIPEELAQKIKQYETEQYDGDDEEDDIDNDDTNPRKNKYGNWAGVDPNANYDGDVDDDDDDEYPYQPEGYTPPPVPGGMPF